MNIDEHQADRGIALQMLRLGQSGNREGVHALLLQLENDCIALLRHEDQARFRERQ